MNWSPTYLGYWDAAWAQNSLIMLSRDLPTPTHFTTKEERQYEGFKLARLQSVNGAFEQVNSPHQHHINCITTIQADSLHSFHKKLCLETPAHQTTVFIYDTNKRDVGKKKERFYV